VSIGHEATVSKIGDEQLFYLQSRGIKKEEAEAMIVAGFIEPIVKELPMEYAVEMNRLIQLQMEGSVGGRRPLFMAPACPRAGAPCPSPAARTSPRGPANSAGARWRSPRAWRTRIAASSCGGAPTSARSDPTRSTSLPPRPRHAGTATCRRPFARV